MRTILSCFLLFLKKTQVSSDKSSASSFLSRCAAAISLSELVRPLLAVDAARIMQILNILKERCPGQSKAGIVNFIYYLRPSPSFIKTDKILQIFIFNSITCICYF